MARIGIYSGTFDPIHTGHIAFALAAKQTYGLDEVVIIPEPEPRGKTAVSALSHRIAMIERAVRPHDGLRALTLSSERFTVADTLPELQTHFPDTELSLLIGSDVAHSLTSWQGLDTLGDIRFIVGLRRHDTKEALANSLAVTGVAFDFIAAKDATAHASSSAARSGNLSHLPVEVRRYIQTHRLYVTG